VQWRNHHILANTKETRKLTRQAGKASAKGRRDKWQATREEKKKNAQKVLVSKLSNFRVFCAFRS